MSRDLRFKIMDALPSHPLSGETVKELGESDVVVGTMPIESRFNDVITEFLLYSEAKIYAVAFDPETETWNLLESQSYDRENRQDVEEELMGRLYNWREEYVLPYLVENDLIPSFRI